MSQPDHNLKAALIQWRHETALQRLGPAVVRSYGAKVFISDQIIERLVVCAHAFKLAGVDSIVRETGWRKDQAEEHGATILEVIYAHIPLPVPPPIAPTGSANSAPHTAQVKHDAGPTTCKRRLATCSKCHQEGHISTYYLSLLVRHACLFVKGSNRSCPARVASRAYNSGIHTTVANENLMPHSTEDSMGSSLPPNRSYYRHVPYTRTEPTTQVLNNVQGPSPILASTSRSNHYVQNLPVHPTNPIFYQHSKRDDTPLH